MIIGIPKEIMHDEGRVSAIPETVKKMVADGAAVLVESGAGAGSFYSDEEYKAAGAELVDDVAEVYERADVILKVKEPLFNEAKGVHEVDMMKKGQYLITFIHPASPVNHEMVKKLAAKGVISITLDGIPRISRAQNMDALTSMSTCAGYKGIMLAANDLAKFVPQIFCAVGMIKPANAMVIGTGVGGLQAIATAKRLGARVEAFDTRPVVEEQVKSLGAKFVKIDLGETGQTAQGYAKELTPEQIELQRRGMAKVCAQSDVIITTAKLFGRKAPRIITAEMVMGMKAGSVIIDMAVESGGNVEGSKPDEIVITPNGVTIIGDTCLEASVPATASQMYSSNVYNYIAHFSPNGTFEPNFEDPIMKVSAVTHDGQITDERFK